jgi:hypothetical protein
LGTGIHSRASVRAKYLLLAISYLTKPLPLYKHFFVFNARLFKGLGIVA